MLSPKKHLFTDCDFLCTICDDQLPTENLNEAQIYYLLATMEPNPLNPLRI
jgi:hypothetical protein